MIHLKAYLTQCVQPQSLMYLPQQVQSDATCTHTKFHTAVAAGEHWPRLLKDTGKVGRNIKVDWNKWVDEDEEDDKPDDFDMSQLQNMQQFGGGMGGGMGGMGGGMPGMPGMSDMNFEDLEGDAENINGAEDSDDELPPPEKET